MPDSRGLRSTMRFLKGFLADPLSVGSVIPSSRKLSERMLASQKFQDAKVVVEIGTGTGPVTSVILEKIGPEAKYLGLDLNLEFINELRKRFPRANFVAESAENLPAILERMKLKKADYVISGLPWTLFSDELQKTLLKSIYDALDDQGEMATFVYLPVLYTPLGKRFRKNLHLYFEESDSKSIELWNLPSAAVIRVQKKH